MPQKSALTKEMEHITQEMYKRNLELTERNKTLSILRKIEEIILSSVTDMVVIAKEVSEIVLKEAGFRGVFLRVLNKNKKVLEPLSIVFSPPHNKISNEAMRQLFDINIAIKHRDNVMVKAVLTNSPQKTNQFYFLEYPYVELDKAYQQQKLLDIKSFIVYPLVIRGKVMGTMTIAIGKNEEYDYENRKDLLSRLPRIVSIALENAMLYQTIQKNNERLKELDKLKDEFVSVASHELRTPLTAIRSYLWMALKGKGGALTEKQQYYLDRSYNSTIRLINLVNEMLNTSRIESGRMKFIMKKENIVGLIKNVIEEVLPRAKELGVLIRFDPSKKEIFALMDQDKIQEVLLNLIGNSLKFTPKGGKIMISCIKKGEEITVSIHDGGSGIEPDDLPRLFQKFGMIEGSYATNQSASQGTGLGLFICKAIIEKHQGRIWAESPGKNMGSTFAFTLLSYSSAKEKEFDHGESETGLDIIHNEFK